MLFSRTRRHGQWTALFSLLFATTCILGQDTSPCIVHDNGKIYDLNPLKSKTDYEIVTQKGRKLFLNVCQSVKTETFGLKDDGISPSEIGAFIRRDHGDFSIGKVNTSMSVFNSEARFTMADGSQCTSSSSNARASSLVNFICDSSSPGPGSPQLVGSLPPGDEDAACAFIIEWKTSYACGIAESGGFWKFFTTLIVTLLILLASYTILGTLYNHFILNLTGLDSIPQFSFQSMLYHIRQALEWTKDVLGILFINYCSGRGGYDILPSSHNHNPRTPNPVSHQAQVFGIVNGGHGTHDEREREQSGGGGVFTRPKPSPKPAQHQQHQQQRPTTNPVSHHSQVVQSLSQSTLSPNPNPNPNPNTHPHPHPHPHPYPYPDPATPHLQPQTSTTPISPMPQMQTHPTIQPFLSSSSSSSSSTTTIAPPSTQEEERQFMLFSTDEQEQEQDGQDHDHDGNGSGNGKGKPAIQL